MAKSFLASTPQDLQRTLNEESRRMQEQATMGKARVLHLPYINLQALPIDLNVLSLLSEEEARRSGALIFFKDGQELRVGVLDPHNQYLETKIKELQQQKQDITLHLISQSSFDDTVKFYSKILIPKSTYSDQIIISKVLDYGKILEEFKKEEIQLSKTPTEFLTDIFAAAMFFEASDIHLEAEEKFTKVRYRIDGVLHDMLHITSGLQKTILSKIKVLANLKINVDAIPQDGRLTFFYLQKPVDVRVSTLPSAYGEGVVLRLLGVGAVNLKVVDLGFWGKAAKVIEAQLTKPNGMIINTGPTGSGKTTSLYAFLNELNQPGVKIITLEDPIEYKLPGIQQSPIDHHVDFSFAKGLRAILRQDPDILMVGEIRDSETAETAMQAALTGHVVLTTLHTNNASGAIPRLLTMGVKPYTLAPAINAIIAQRLVRRLCEHCKEPIVVQSALLEKVSSVLHNIPKAAEVDLPKVLQFFHSPGCSACKNLGYKGRIGIFEVIENTDTIKELIFKDAAAIDIKKQAVLQGMITMTQDGLLKALRGITDIEEVFRVAGRD